MSNELAIVTFETGAVATYGNKFLNFVHSHEQAKEAAEAAILQANNRDAVIDTQLLQAVLFLHHDEQIDVMSALHGNAAVKKLNQATLIALGVQTWTSPAAGEAPVLTYTDANIAELYDVSNVDKESPDYAARSSRRVALNQKLKRAYESAIAILDANGTYESIVTVEGDNGELRTVLRAGPKEIMGDQSEVVLGSRGAAKANGATLAPTLTSLSRVTRAAHDNGEDATSKGATETATRKDGEGTVDKEDFLAMLNAFTNAVKGREGTFDRAEKTAMKNLAALLAEQLA